MRNKFIQTLTQLAAKHDDIFLVCGDLGYSVLEPFAEQFPDRFLNAGVAEQNMTQVAAGLAREGYNVFTYSIGNFPTLRCMEQIRYDVCYHQSNVKVVAVGGGYAYGPQGVSHHTTEDLAMLRVLPHMTMCIPADAAEAEGAARFMATHKGPGYIRLNKAGEPAVHTQLDTMAPGQFIQVRDGAGTALVGTGAILHAAIRELDAAGKAWAVYSAPFVGSYGADALKPLAERYERIVTIEEHQLNGGFGASVAEVFSDMFDAGTLRAMPRLKRIAIPNAFIGVSGSQEYLRQVAGLSLKEVL